MDKQRKRTLTAIILNSAVIIMVLVYLIMRLVSAGNEILGNSGLGMLKYYTNLSNFLAGIVAVIVLPYEIISFKRGKDILPLWALLAKFAITIALLITFLVTACFLGPTNVANGGSYWALFAGGNLIVHLLVPIIASTCFCLFETKPTIKFHFSFIGMSTLMLYAIFYIINFYAHLIPGGGIQGQSEYDWYGFFGDKGTLGIVLTIFAMLAFSYLLSFLVWLANKKSGQKIWKGE